VIEIRRFADYRQVLSVDAYREGLRRRAGKSTSKVTARKPHDENGTAVIPDEVFGLSSPPCSSSRWPDKSLQKISPVPINRICGDCARVD
jgi:hypothetical protein